MIEWKPIEDAPKDGTAILIVDESWYPTSIALVRYKTFNKNECWVEMTGPIIFTPTHYSEIGEGP